MRILFGTVLLFWGALALAQEQVIAQGTDNQAPQVELKLPPKSNPPLIQNYRTENGDLAAVITPESGDQYFYVPVQEAYQTQNPQDREADVPINTGNWVIHGW